MSNKFTKEQVEHIADLARIGLSDKEKEEFQNSFGSVLDFVDKLQEVDVSGVEPTAHITGLENSTRKDGGGLIHAGSVVLLDAVPDRKDRHVKVKKVLKI